MGKRVFPVGGALTRRHWLAGAAAGAGLAGAGLALPALWPQRGAAQDAASPGLGTLARERGISFGAAMQSNLLATDPAYGAAFDTEAALLVPEWEGKWAALQPEEGKFDTRPLDAILGWARQRGRVVRGHALLWHIAMPDWLTAALGEGPARAQALMEAHFDRILSHTREQIRDWDVVNEVIANPPGSDVPHAGDSALRDTPWLRALGPSYIDMALRMARQRDRTLRLTINEYGIEEDTPDAAEKRRRFLALLRGLLERNVPLDAVGIQAHLQLHRPFTPAPFAAFLAELRQMGLAVLVTEMDIRETRDAPTEIAARDALVAERVYAFTATALEGGVRSFLTWGLSDKYSWLVSDPAVALGPDRSHRGLPLDETWQRKPMWHALARAFRGGG
ncbi:endo-1,4-beta-xylanase [Teichococcus cervicalis]|uniref:Beta-xylanase n=1 Tax=Pseudoroseomonas cervicalis ATCC 49957 TaxID=525371 RepID=D5RI74_9PROT|nr:endo-1,4-beta-xylanase [Pseudoroseomonas cervicalis]EFH13009.1 glycosyl hydrolase family 10 [Pseudoroseomonas cervicalis ATCC 49957]